MGRLLPLIVCIMAAFLYPSTAISQKADTPDVQEIAIPYTKYVLDNGLTLIVHEDHKAPIVAVNVWYKVGSKNEQVGKTGFAHLFEHLMFNGSEHYNDDYFKPLEQVGATDMNGTTNRDRTNYFQNVPTTAVDMALWMESDRMGHMLGAITQEKLDEQRGVVQNEKRQGENQPYGQVYNLMAEHTYPEGHPYSWPVIGSMENLNAASLEDVHQWFKTYYGPSNAVLVLAGDIDPETAKEKVEKYFGDIPAGPPVTHQEQWIAKREGEQRQVLQDRVPQARIYKVWNIPSWGSKAHTQLDLAADILASGKTSRLYKRLVYEDQIATDVSAFVYSGKLGSQFIVQATAQPGGNLTVVEETIDEELNRLLAQGPKAREVQRVQTQYISDFVRGIERVGGFGGKSDILAKNEVYTGQPDHYKTVIEDVQQTSPEQIQNVMNAWLSDGVYALKVHPFPEYAAADSGVDRSELPEVDTPPEARFPDLQRSTLSNGTELIVAERHGAPLVNISLLVDAGYAADNMARPGTASLTLAMLDEGTTSRSSLEISETLDMLGAELSTGSNLDISTVGLSTLKSTLDEALGVYADVVLNPSFPEEEFQRLKKEQHADIQREKVTPMQMALRVFPQLLYGADHPYGTPFTGSGTEKSLSAIAREDLSQFHETWFKPNNATLVVVGDITMEEIKPKLEQQFKTWASGNIPEKEISTVDQQDEQVVYLMNRPGSQQSVILAGHVAPPKANPHEIAIETMNGILGGTFTSRINMNLREDKHWAYGARSFIIGARGQRPFMAYAPVQSDKTSESMQEIAKELRGIQDQQPITPEELSKAKKNQTLTLPGDWETIDEIESSIQEIVRYKLADNYYETYVSDVRSLTQTDVQNAARSLIKPDQLIWVVVGDLQEIEPEIRKLGFGEIRYINANGQVVDKSSAAGQ